MIVGDYQEQLRKQRIMLDVLPDERMWEAWKKTDSKARQGKGFNPNLDKCFLEFLVSTEIDSHSYAHDVEPATPLERCQRNFEKVRRVAQIRIGQERLAAYQARVREAFFAYVEGCQNWTTWDGSSGSDCSARSSDSKSLIAAKEKEVENALRGRDKGEKQARRSERGKAGKRASVSSSVSSAPSETSLNTPRHGQTMDHTVIKASEDMDVDEDEAVMTVTVKDVIYAARRATRPGTQRKKSETSL